jgi:hypothetical protein
MIPRTCPQGHVVHVASSLAKAWCSKCKANFPIAQPKKGKR